MLGYWMHVAEDQLGFMRSVLLPPLTKKRIPGLMLGRRMQGVIKFATAWLMIGLITWNINRHLPLVSLEIPRVTRLPDPTLLLVLVAPSIAIYTAGIIDRVCYSKVLKELRKEKEAEEALEEREEIGGL